MTPCRDEAEYARCTLDSVVNQTVKPTLWLIVDDGSTDETPEILAEYADRHDFIRVVRKPNRGVRKVGPGVIEAFYFGLEQVELEQFEFSCKFDLDLELPQHYFEIVLDRMRADPRLGTFSGKPYFRDAAGELVSEGCGDETSVGMIKFYRNSCFEEIGGYVRQVMWDGIDCHRCRMLGWKAASADEPDLRFEHLRPMGSSHKGVLVGRRRHGFGQYFMGTAPLYMTASALYRMTRPPLVLGGLNMLIGYASAAIRREPRYDDAEFRRFLRKYQRDCLVRGKRAATQRLDDRQQAVWAERHGSTQAAV